MRGEHRTPPSPGHKCGPSPRRSRSRSREAGSRFGGRARYHRGEERDYRLGGNENRIAHSRDQARERDRARSPGLSRVRTVREKDEWARSLERHRHERSREQPMTRDIQAEGRERGHDRHETIERRCGAEDHTRANGETDAHASRGGRDDLRGPRGDTELVGEATALGDGEDAVWARRRAGAMEDDIDMDSGDEQPGTSPMRGDSDDPDELELFMAEIGANAAEVGRWGVAPVEDVRPESLGHGDSDMSVGSIGVGLDEVPVPGAPIIRTAVGQREVLDDWTFSDGEGSARDSVGENRDAAGIIEDDAAWAEAVRWGRLSKGDKLAELASMKPSSYPSFRRRFYIEPPEVSSMSMEEVQQVRRKMDGIKVRGRAVPAPIQSWNQAGLSQRVQDALRKAGYPSPMPIQAQALPAVMSGRDCIGIAKTGSGKTLAYVLPLLRHVKDQPPLQDGDGPVGLVIAPTRELVVQIGKECRRFARVVGLSCVAVYGGSGVGSQIADLKRGAEVVVCTPGRMIDVLVTGNGKITNLWRVTMLVVDEADRLFDLGFEPQVMRIIDQIRPDRQTVLFSATFPKQVEVLARQLLVDPVEILVGGRSVVNSSIRQVVEVREPEDRLIRLLEILGEWYDRGKVLVFVQKQESCDVLFRELLQLGYPCMSLHGGKDQADRGSTIADFKAGVCNVLIATSLAARGLDIPDLVLVVNYDVPNHLEDYVHRVGRTGRAGNEGTAITFISCEEAQYAPDLVRALKDSGAPVPEDLLLLADSFVKLVKAGKAAKHGSGYGGSGFKFDDKEDDQKKAERVAVLKEYGVEMGEHIELMVADADKAADRGESEDDEGIATPKEVAASAAGIASVSGASAGELRSRRSRFDCTAGPPKAGVVTGAPQQEEEVPPAMESDGKQAGWRPNEPLRPKPRGPTTAEATRAAAQAAAVAAALSGGHLLSSKLAATRVAEQYSQTLESARDRVIADKEGRDIKGEKRPLQTEWSEFADELEINDFVQHARYRVTHRDVLRDVTEATSCSVVVRGNYYKPGSQIAEGDRKLYLYIEGPNTEAVRKAKRMVKHIIEEATEKALKKEAKTSVI